MLAAGAMAMAALACGDDGDGDDPTPAPSATQPASTAEPEATDTPEADPTETPGEGGLNTIVEAARANDAAALEALVRYEPVPCTTNVQGIGGPPECEPDEADGTPVDVVFATTCEGFYAREGALNFAGLSFGVFGSGNPLYGVYELDPASQLARVEPWAGARFVIVMNLIGSADQNFVYALITDGEQIIGTAAGCGESPEEWVANQGLGPAVEVP
jgi:hypothetical protein